MVLSGCRLKVMHCLLLSRFLAFDKARNPKLKSSCYKIQGLLKKFSSWTLNHIDRSLNEEAHLATQSMITKVFLLKADAPMYLGRESLSKEEIYLLTGTLSYCHF